MRIVLTTGLIFFAAIVDAQKLDSLLSGVYYWDKLESKEEDMRMRRDVLEGKTFALDHFEVYALTLEAGMSYPLHHHADKDELMIMKEGELKVIINEKVKVLGPGGVAFTMAGDQQEVQNLGTAAATYYILTYRSKLPTDKERAKKEGGSFLLNWNELKTSDNGKGYRRDFFDRGTSQLRQFEMHTTALNPDSVNHAPHTHEQEEIVLIVKGNVEMQVGDKRYKAAAGDLYFLSSNMLHGSLRNIGKEQCEYFAIQWRN